MNTVLKQKIDNLINELQKKKDKRLSAFIGLDGFVDEAIHVVDTRFDQDNFKRISSITAFSERIARAAGLSTNIEFVVDKTKIGGNGPIFALSLLKYGVSVSYAGALGRDGVPEPIFKEIVDKCEKVFSLCAPGHSDALEFFDGKLILGKLSSLNEITWLRVKEVLGGVQGIAALFEGKDVVGMENWTMIPNMNEIWEGIIDEVFPLLIQDNEKEKPIVFLTLLTLKNARLRSLGRRWSL